jgi:type IV secretion system protein VirB8
MNKHSHENLDSYYAEAASWNRDRVQSMRSSRRIAWAIAGAAALIAVLEGIALVLLVPLKTVEPYTLMVDRTTGYVQELKPLDKQKVAPDAALTQSFLVQYVIGREGFDIATLNTNYRKVALLSADVARTSYLASMQVSNPDSPLVRYPRSTVVDVRVKSISPIGANAELVRFDTIRADVNGTTQPPSPWVAVVRYRYSNSPMTVDDRFMNPLGFQVTSYRKDPEALPPAVTAPAGTQEALPVGTGTAPIRSYYPGPASLSHAHAP